MRKGLWAKAAAMGVPPSWCLQSEDFEDAPDWARATMASMTVQNAIAYLNADKGVEQSYQSRGVLGAIDALVTKAQLFRSCALVLTDAALLMAMAIRCGEMEKLVRDVIMETGVDVGERLM